MLKIKLHWEINVDGDLHEDSVVLEGDDDADIGAKIRLAVASRGLDYDENNCWTEDL